MSSFNPSSLLMIFSLLSFLVFNLTVSMSCPTRCGGIDIPYPFGIGEGCYLNKWYEIKCDHNNSLSVSGKLVPVLSVIGKEVVSISFPGKLLSYGSNRMPYGKVRIKNPIISKGCSSNEQESTSLLNLTGSPFYVSDSNTLVAIGCNNKASLTNIEPSIVGCFSSCLSTNHTTSKDYLETVNCNTKSYTDDEGYGYCSERSYINETSCNGNRCCKASMPGSIQQVVGVRIDDNTTARGGCKVAFLTYDQAYSLLDGSDPNLVLAKRYSTVEFGWFIHTTDLLSFVDSLKYAIEVTREIHTFRAGVKEQCRVVADLASRDLYSDALVLPIRAKHDAPSYSNTLVKLYRLFLFGYSKLICFRCCWINSVQRHLICSCSKEEIHGLVG
ncbi:hypothetical protein DY000_02034423 [Brassica cretica]|uniref:Wall-associated receptor kinase galacturonan-binding domain-containing protein n=1 Tax=Brassica cretica TaxID=69181 RepID=A0ABQ7DW18_BRACR|nr:hypothetical protein DY000_02034423 [Brassica cretica]